MFLQNQNERQADITALIVEDKNTFNVVTKLTKELLVRNSSELCCYQLLNHEKWKEILFGIFRLLSHQNKNLCANAAYIIGAICKYDVGKERVVDLLEEDNDDMQDFLNSINTLLTSTQDECLMNALGIIATLADCQSARLWLLKKFELDDTVQLACKLINRGNDAITNNASLFIARLTIDEEGCARLLNLRFSNKIILQLINSLVCESPNQAMNAAFALGRLFQLESCQRNLMLMKQSDQMILNLINMLFSENTGCKKNSCYALQSLASASPGYDKLLNHAEVEKMMFCFIDLLKNEEMAIFSAFLIQSIVLHKKGCLYMRDHPSMRKKLTTISKKENLCPELLEELENVLEYLEDLPKPDAPKVVVESPDSVAVHWTSFHPKNDLSVVYHLFQGTTEIYSGANSKFVVQNLKPTQDYAFHMQLSCEGAMSPISDDVKVTMPESVPSAPTNFGTIFRSTSQIKVSWESPSEPNGVLTGYLLSMKGKQPIEMGIDETNYLFINLQACTQYHLQVFAVTREGKGPAADLQTSTNSLAMYAPSKPRVSVLGRTEISISWESPEIPLGRLNYFEVRMNDQVIYTGVDRHFIARALQPGKEYYFKVSAWTSEGRCDSEVSCRKTPKQCRRKEYKKPQ